MINRNSWTIAHLRKSTKENSNSANGRWKELRVRKAAMVEKKDLTRGNEDRFNL